MRVGAARCRAGGLAGGARQGSLTETAQWMPRAVFWDDPRHLPQSLQAGSRVPRHVRARPESLRRAAPAECGERSEDEEPESGQERTHRQCPAGFGELSSR